MYGRGWPFRALIGSLVLCLWSPSAIAANKLVGIDYSLLSTEGVQIELTLSGSAPEPRFFAIASPPCIVLDLPGVTIGSIRHSRSIEIGKVHSIALVEAKERTRAVINLVQSTPFEVKTEGNTVYVTVGGATVTTTTVDAGSAAEARQHLIKAIDFRRAAEGGGIVTVSLSDTRMPIDIRRENGRVVVDFIGGTLPPRLERRLDVLDFATPVKFIDAFSTEPGARMVIIPKDVEYEYFAYLYDNTLVVELRALSGAQNARVAEGREYNGETISLNFQNVKVRAALQEIADFTGFNLVVSDAVQGTITLQLEEVPWDQALDIILQMQGLGMRRNGNVVLIAPREKIVVHKRQELRSQKKLKKLAPLHLDIIPVNFAEAGDLAKLISAKNNSFLSSRGSVAVDERTNTLIIQDTAERLAAIRKLISRLDKPVQQVLIEARVVIANSDFSKDLGVRFGLSKLDTSGGVIDQIATSGSLEGTTQLLSSQPLQIGDRLNVNLPAANANAAKLALALTGLPLGTLLELELSALEAEGRGKVISNPRIITTNQQTAVIKQGVKIPYQEKAGEGAAGATSIAFKEAVLQLKVTPQITPNGKIIMDLVITKDSVGRIFNGVPSINTRKISTQVIVDNGQTIVLGGIYERRKTHSVQRVPFLGGLPFIGALFRSTSTSYSKKELLIFITPKIIEKTSL